MTQLKKKTVFVFDLDDTLFDTSGELRRIMLEEHGIFIDRQEYLTNENTNGLLDVIQNEGQYMVSVPLYPEHTPIWAVFQKVRSAGHEIHVCTHRGFHEKAKELSEQSFAKYELEFDNVHYLHPEEYPDKLKYLDAYFGDVEYVIFDDRPTGSSVEPIVADNVYLIDQFHNRHIQAKKRIQVNQVMDAIHAIMLLLAVTNNL